MERHARIAALTVEGQLVAIKHEAAFHEAGHAVVAYLSAYHSTAGGIELAVYGKGEFLVALNKIKLRNAGLPPTEESAKNPVVAKDLARVLVAGLVAERIAAERDDTLVPHPPSAAPDHELARQILEEAGLSRKFDRFEVEANDLLRERWEVVEALADWAFRAGSIGGADLIVFLQTRL